MRRLLTRRLLAYAVISGVILALAAGLVERPQVSIVESRYYGFPFIWVITKTLAQAEFLWIGFVSDVAFWIVVALTALIVTGKIFRPTVGTASEIKRLSWLVFLILILGLLMIFVHELGHVIWGAAAGGTLSRVQIAFFQLFPKVAVTSQFCLGSVEMNGLISSAQTGLFLLGGSTTTNVLSWLLSPLTFTRRLSSGRRRAVKIVGTFGLLDLPLYVALPQFGLQHWIVLGGSRPEPLVGARMLGIDDPVFVVLVVFTTFGLVSAYFGGVRTGLWNGLKTLRDRL